MFSGTIIAGRFGIERFGEMPDGGVSLPGTVSATTGFHFTVSSPLPEPASIALMLAGLGVDPVIAKRRRAIRSNDSFRPGGCVGR